MADMLMWKRQICGEYLNCFCKTAPDNRSVNSTDFNHLGRSQTIYKPNRCNDANNDLLQQKDVPSVSEDLDKQSNGDGQSWWSEQQKAKRETEHRQNNIWSLLLLLLV